MKEITGKYNTAKIMTDTADEGTLRQIETMCDQKSLAGSKLVLMPDCHVGKGSTIGTTMTITDKIIPNIVGLIYHVAC